ncbi:indolepyruvate oxidoreductase subunit beta [Serpentinicella alkaliphila]|uniref:Indolepyruvate ferredoxin oxidoreductase beta subunit n=1 Tax=Serpentinicella alkaliphila TaxID=1734049 RepID=A0A4R2T821_9FIRM|nr:indolepyruvate oxidoreductase subunit beta [Serpentinicella alkaliphila]QUH24387.1 indolepyruvate oxidoreductase subunit beta [Serpentinicella alkaliphila]TCP98345.1 indolepyruvate ferredoxin oxidoreductase beta subunit [Serpentinicella alkaliphila]
MLSVDTKNILLVGVGGQGIILASKILSLGLISAGYDTKMSEVHGMAQRGGSVTTQVRYGNKVYSPIIGRGQADIIVAFEKMESLRWLDYLKPTGKVVINDFVIPSLPTLIGSATYTQNAIDVVQDIVRERTIVIKAGDIAKELGDIKTQNIVLLGSLIKAVGLEHLNWANTIRESVKEELVEPNLKAIEAGIRAVK